MDDKTKKILGISIIGGIAYFALTSNSGEEGYGSTGSFSGLGGGEETVLEGETDSGINYNISLPEPDYSILDSIMATSAVAPTKTKKQAVATSDVAFPSILDTASSEAFVQSMGGTKPLSSAVDLTGGSVNTNYNPTYGADTLGKTETGSSLFSGLTSLMGEAVSSGGSSGGTGSASIVKKDYGADTLGKTETGSSLYSGLTSLMGEAVAATKSSSSSSKQTKKEATSSSSKNYSGSSSGLSSYAKKSGKNIVSVKR